MLGQALPSSPVPAVGSLLCSCGHADRIFTKFFISPPLEWLKVGGSVSPTALLCQLFDKHIKQLEITRDPPGPPGTVFPRWLVQDKRLERPKFRISLGSQGQGEARRQPRDRGVSTWGAEGGVQVPSAQEHRSQVLPAGATDKTGAAKIAGRQVCENRIIYNSNSNLWKAHLAIHAMRHF